MQKLLFSATLSQNPEKLTHLNLFQPRLVTTLVTQGQQRRSRVHQEVAEEEQEETGEFVGKFTTPVGLTVRFHFSPCSLVFKKTETKTKLVLMIV